MAFKCEMACFEKHDKAKLNIDWEDDDWIDYCFDLAGEVAALSSIAGILEANLPDTFTTCR